MKSYEKTKDQSLNSGVDHASQIKFLKLTLAAAVFGAAALVVHNVVSKDVEENTASTIKYELSK